MVDDFVGLSVSIIGLVVSFCCVLGVTKVCVTLFTI